jgi:hypothetical protein
MSRSRVTSRTTRLTVAALGPVLAVSLAACGGSSSAGSATPAAATPNANATGAPGGGRGFGGADFTKIQACLKAAGINLPTGTRFPRPSGSFTPRGTPPSGGVRPSGVRPSGGFGGGGGRGGGFGGEFNTPQVKAALAACGITVPTGGGGGPRPTATANS